MILKLQSAHILPVKNARFKKSLHRGTVTVAPPGTVAPPSTGTAALPGIVTAAPPGILTVLL